MKRSKALKVVAALTLAAVQCSPAVALPPPPGAPFTLWNFLGIPQGFHKIRDATANKFGNHPGLERKPPLKAIADPENLLSPNPAIKAAAEIKTQEDLAPQKIKALKYLSTIGCGCYPDVKEAMMAALEDCTEEVRYQAVLAIQDASTQHCARCNRDCCCDQELVLKLSQIAYERNDKGCFLEPSERVREAAKAAMRSCCPGTGPVTPQAEPAPAPPPQNLPEGVPAPPPAPPLPEDASALHGAGQPSAAGAVRVFESQTKIIMPNGDTIFASEGEEIADGMIVESAPRLPQPAPAASPRSRTIATPAATRSTLPAKSRSGTVPPLGNSSRRAASQRGLAAPEPLPAETSVAMEELPPVPAAVPAQPPKNILPSVPSLKKLLQPGASQASAVVITDKAAAETASYVSDNTTLAPKLGPPPAAVRQQVTGIIARVSPDSGTVEIRVPRGSSLLVGDRLKIKHEYLLESTEVGYVEVISIGPRGATARPVDSLKLESISRGDEATFAPPAPARRPTFANTTATING